MPPGPPPSRTASAPARTSRTARCPPRPDAAGTGPAQQSPAGGGRLPRLLPPAGQPGSDLAAHLGRHGPVPYRGWSARLIPEVRAAGLTGRGGAAFPVHRKLEAVAAASGRAVVVGNAAEGQPASHNDEALLRRPAAPGAGRAAPGPRAGCAAPAGP